MMRTIGLAWAPLTRSYTSYQRRSIQDYLLPFDIYVKLMRGPRCEYVFIFTDEFYVNINHAYKNAWVPKDKKTKLSNKEEEWHR